MSSEKTLKKIFFLIYFILTALGLHCCTWVLSSCREQRLPSSCGVRASHCSGFSCRAWVLGSQASVCGMWALEHRLSSCAAHVSVALDLPGPEIKPVSFALQDGFLTTGLSGKPLLFVQILFFLLFLSLLLLGLTLYVCWYI